MSATTFDHLHATTEARALARRAVAFAPSVWQIIDDVLSRHPEAIYFGSGAPAREAIPLQRLQQAAATAWAGADGALDYGEVKGYWPLRELISRRMAQQGMVVDPSQLLITYGSQQGMDFVAKLMLDPHDLIVVEGPTYPGAMQAFDAYEADYLTIPVDGEGLDVAALAAQLDQIERTPKLIYTIPTFQNPSGITMSGDRRQELLALARARNILVVEDDPYGELWCDAPPPPALRAYDPGVLYLGTFSKTIAPGIRVGWLAAPPDLIEPLTMAKEATDIVGNRIVTRTVYHAAEGFLDDHVVTARDIYRNHRDAMLAALDAEMPPGVAWSRPGGGFFVWLTLPDGIDAQSLLPFAADRGVAFLPGPWFYPNRDVRNTLRLSYSTKSAATITDGIHRLATAIKEYAS
ncbi:MAG: PLP-dependent aminotransferase family protein [Thermomicrobiales bacterium]